MKYISQRDMRDGRPCLRFVRFYIVGILLLLHNPRAGKAMVPEFQSSLAVGDVTPDVDPRHEVRRPQERNLRERIIADAVANAFADVIREKGGDTKSLPTTGKKKTAAVKQPKVTPSGTPVNTKEFAYTNIRFKSFVNDDASDKKDDNFIQSLQETAVQHEAVQQQHEEETKKLVDVSSSQDDTKDLEAQLNAKLAAIQKEMSDLEDLKKAIEASKKEGDKTSGGDAKRRLLFSMPGVQPKAKFKKTFSDIGTPGWDAFRLLNKKGDFFQDNMNQFQKHIGDKSARLNNQLIDLLSLGTDKVADIVKYQGDKQVLRSDNARDILDAVKEGNLEKIGRLQDVLLSAMERSSFRCCGSMRVEIGRRLTLVGGTRQGQRYVPRPARSAKVMSSLTVKESGTGVEFPLVERLWVGGDMRCMGASNRVKKIAFVGIKVYAIAMYVEAQLAAKELGVRDRGGFFETDDDYCSALTDGAFVKLLQIELVRNIEGQQFVEALEESLRPRMALSGDMGSLQKLQDFFMAKSLSKGTVINLVYKLDSSLDICVRESRPNSFESEVPDICIESASLSRALFETYLGASSIIPDAKREWAEGAKKLLESDKIRRDTRPGGSG